MSESPCEGIRLHFLLRRKLMFRCHPAGSLDSIFESRCKGKKKDTQRVSFFLAEQQGFEPWRHFHALRDFESRLFDQLEYCSIFTTELLYQRQR